MTVSRQLDETVAGRYRLERLLAHGGTCEVFSAFDHEKGLRVALKRTTVPAQQPSAALEFMREYHALSTLRDPRLLTVYDFGIDREQAYYTMQLWDGQDLSELSPVPYRTACRYLRDVASALALLHARRLLHRDLSPRNVRLTSDGRCKLLDFSAMMPFGVPPNLTGTPAFIPPEALQAGPLDQRADLYSFGALAYFVLTGKAAHAVMESAALPRVWKKPLQRPSRIVSELPAALDELVISLLSVDPMQRPASAAEVIERLSAIAGLAPQQDSVTSPRALSSAQLIGRSTQTERVRQHVSRALEGSGSALLFCAESGMGRSRMLAETAWMAQTAGLSVLRCVLRSRSAVGALASELVQGLMQLAPAEARGALAAYPAIAAHSFAADSGASRGSLLRELCAFVCAIARERPLSIIVDDLQNADEFSGSLIAALAYQCSDCGLSVVASYDIQHEAPTLAQVPGLAETVWLGALDRSQTIMLATALFGDVANVERVGTWLFRAASGNPRLTLQAAEHLLAQRLVNYVDPGWVLPRELDQELPPSAAPLQGVSAQARALAELLCASRAGATIARIASLARQPPSAVLAALSELVCSGVLASAGKLYVFTPDSLRENLLDSLAPARRQQLHGAWAECLLASHPRAEDQIEAGWHLIHSRAELAGAELLVKIARGWVERRVNMASAVPALERALEIFTRHERRYAQQLELRSWLVMAGVWVDPQLAGRYAQSTLDALYPLTGLAQVERWSRVLGKSLAFLLAVLWTFLGWTVQPRDKRGPHVLAALQYYARAALALASVRALAADARSVHEGLERLRLFEGLPHPSLRTVHALAKAIAQGRGADSEALIENVLLRLDLRRRAPLHMSEADRSDLLAGALMLKGIHECYRERSTALRCVERLEQLGTPLAVAGAMRICMSHYVLRGEAERSDQFRRLLELSARQLGENWQIDWSATGIVWADPVTMRRAVDTLAKMPTQDPAFSGLRDTVGVAQQFRRGDYAAVVLAGEHYLQAYPAFSQPGWACAYAQIALSHIELGDPARALAICEHACPLLYDNHRQYMVEHSTLEAAYAVALVASGQRERAADMFRMLIERMRVAGEHTRAFLFHDYRVKVLQRMGERQAARVLLEHMSRASLGRTGSAPSPVFASAPEQKVLPLRAANGPSQAIR